MSGLIACSDSHVANHVLHGGPRTAGVNRRCREVLDVFGQVAQGVKAGEGLLVAGDLVDRIDLPPQVITALRVELQRLADGGWAGLMIGNHDVVSSEPGDHALGPYCEPGVIIYGRPGLANVGCGWVGVVPVVPGEHYPLMVAEQIRSLADAPTDEPRLLALHCGLEDDTTPPWLRGKGLRVEDLAARCRKAGVGWVIAGDWHEHREWEIDGVHIMQIGALVPTGWDNPGLDGYGSVLRWDGQTLAREVLPGPRFVTVAGPDELAEVKARAPEGTRLYVRMTHPGVTQDQLVASADLNVAAIAVVPGAGPGRVHLPAGVTVEEAVEGWITAYQAPDDVRAAAKEQARACLREAGA